MSLFGIGKKKEENRFSSAQSQFSQQPQTANIPSLPEFPSFDEETNGFPKYESTVADIKKEVARNNDEEVFIPVRNQDFSSKRMASVSVEPPVRSIAPVAPIMKKFSVNDEKPLFVRIDNYKQAMHTLDALKSKLDDAEEVLRAFEDIKSQEDEKLETWRKDLQNMKDKLFSIDKELFEV